MKALRSHLRLAAGIIALTLVSFSLPGTAAAGRASEPQTAQTKSTKLSKKKLKVLLFTAKTDADHQQIAAYYRQEAQRLTNSSKASGNGRDL